MIQITSEPDDSFGVTECGKLLGSIPDFSFANSCLFVPDGSEKRLGTAWPCAGVFLRYTSDGRVYSNAHVEHLELGIVPKPKPHCRCKRCVGELRFSNNVETAPLLVLPVLDLETGVTCPKDTTLATVVKLEGLGDYSNITSVTLVSNGVVEIAVNKGMFEARGRWLDLKAGKTSYCQVARVAAIDGRDREFHIVRDRREWVLAGRLTVV